MQRCYCKILLNCKKFERASILNNDQIFSEVKRQLHRKCTRKKKGNQLIFKIFVTEF
jgi:hypothetical protein